MARDTFVLDALRWRIEFEDGDYKITVLERLAATIRKGKSELIDRYAKELASYPKVEFRAPKELDIGK